MRKRQLEILLGHSLGDPQRSRSYELERLLAHGVAQQGMMYKRLNRQKSIREPAKDIDEKSLSPCETA